jgi:multiple sugar transport system ATP-binding protein
MRAEIKALHQRLKTTTVYVTHDQIEAMTMADRIVVMHDGIVEQIGTPLELFDRPGNLFVAQFIGSPAMNVFKGTVQGNAVHALNAQWAMPTNINTTTPGQQVYFGIRPTDLNLASSGIAAKVVVVEPTGAETELLLQIGEQSFTLVMHGRTDVKPDDTVYLQFDANKAHVFDATSEQRL